MHFRIPGLGWECGWPGEIAGDTSNRSRGSRGGDTGRSSDTMASGGSGNPARSCGHEKAEGKGKEGPARVLTTVRSF
jgi:hypothetical protein